MSNIYYRVHFMVSETYEISTISNPDYQLLDVVN